MDVDPLDMGALQLVQKRMRELMNETADRVAGGEAKDFGQYQRLVGVIEGLALAERILLDVADIQTRGI